MIKPQELRRMVLFMRRNGVKTFELEGCKVEFDSAVLISDALATERRARARKKALASISGTDAESESTVAQLEDETADVEAMTYWSA